MVVADLRLDGHTALVTGAGGGLGRAIAERLAALGAAVYGTSRNPETAEHIAARYGTAPLTLDLGNTDCFSEFVAGVQRINGGIDLLVNNAGINTPDRRLDLNRWHLTVRWNFRERNWPYSTGRCNSWPMN